MSNTTPPNKLDFNEGQNLGAALQRRLEIAQQKVVSRETDAELAGLNKYISKTLNECAEHLLGCWFIIETEYDPLVTGIAALLRRGNALNQQRIAQQLQAQKQHEAELAQVPLEGAPNEQAGHVETPLTPPNVIPLNAKGQGIVVAPNI